MEIHDGVLAHRLLNNKQLVKATLSEMKYSAMKEKLKKVFTSDTTSVLDGIKLERIENESVFYNIEKPIARNKHDNVYYSRGSYHVPRGGRRGDRNIRGGNRFTCTRRKTNPLHEKGEISKCAICASIFHWANKCPDSYEKIRSNDRN